MAEHTRGGTSVRSDIAHATASDVHVHGLDLVDMLGRVSLGDFAYLELFARLPDERESRLFNAIIVSLVEHGLTPSALVSRLTALGAPESLQGAVAAGLLGLGDTFVGTIEGAARLCQTRLPHDDEGRLVPCTDAEIATIATDVVAEAATTRTPIAGIGHPVHKPVDPRAEKLCAISNELGFPTEPIRLMREIARQASEQRGKLLPLNATGAIGATSTQLGVPWGIARGLGVMARAIGLVGHLLEERRRPLAATVWTRAERESSMSNEGVSDGSWSGSGQDAARG
jgi:citrate synthase